MIQKHKEINSNFFFNFLTNTWPVALPNRFSYVLSPSIYVSDKLPNLSPLGLGSFYVQMRMKLLIIIGLMLGHEALLVYSCYS